MDINKQLKVMNLKIFLIFSVFFCTNQLKAQSFYDLGTIETIEITFSQSNWDQLLDDAYATTGDYIMAESVVINGTVYDSVGVKYKGNSTYNVNQTKNPFHIELDTYKEHDHEGYTDIKLSNVANDPSFVREVLSYQILRQYMYAPLSNFANVSVNGNLMGLYSNSEAVSKKFVKSRFGSKSNTFVKCNPPDGAGPSTTTLPDLVYYGTDSSLYYDGYELKSDYGWDELINLCDTLENNISEIEEILDVDKTLWMLAFDNALVNLDSYIGAFQQNYYLYRDDYDRFLCVVWDLNESFGKFSMTGTGVLGSTADKQQLSYLLNESDADFPLVQKLLSIPRYKRMYLAHYKTILEENFDSGQYYTWGQTLQTLIDASVQADVNKFYTYANFTSNLTSDITGGGGPGGPGGNSIPGITNLMDGRSAYLLGLSDFTQTQPTISNIVESNTSPALNEVITVTATITDENAVYLGYRTESGAPFTKLDMFDDGAHNDGAANDGVYGVDLTISSLQVEYYIYAENSNIGMFSPERAEFELYIITPVIAIADVVINEFMASNGATAFDQNFEADDWIELYNNTASDIDLSGYYLSDDSEDLTKWTFSSGTSIAADGYLIIWADEDGLTQTGLHADFKLSASGESVFLSSPSVVIEDYVGYSAQTQDISYGRIPNGTGAFQTMYPTHNAENSLEAGLDEESNQLGVKVYPNPAISQFQIELDTYDGVERTIGVYGPNGAHIFNDTMTNQITIDASDWSAGFYFIHIEDRVMKLIIN